MAAVEDEVEERYQDVDIETLLSRVQRRPLTFSRSKSVYIAPEFTQRLKGEETVDEGSDLTLTFKVTGLPQPTLRWFKDDEEVADHPRLTVEEKGDGGYRLTLHQVNKGDEAAYRCRAENSEGSSSCCFFLTVKGKPKSPKREHSGKGHKRTVSFPTMFSTIVEKVEEEEKCGRETAQAPESPLTHFYTSLTLPERQTWPSFLGDWAFVNGRHKTRGGSAGPEGSGLEGGARHAKDAKSGESHDVLSDTTEGGASSSVESSASDLVLCRPEGVQGAQRVGTVPADASRTQAKAAPRGAPETLFALADVVEAVCDKSLKTKKKKKKSTQKGGEVNVTQRPAGTSSSDELASGSSGIPLSRQGSSSTTLRDKIRSLMKLSKIDQDAPDGRGRQSESSVPKYKPAKPRTGSWFVEDSSRVADDALASKSSQAAKAGPHSDGVPVGQKAKTTTPPAPNVTFAASSLKANVATPGASNVASPRKPNTATLQATAVSSPQAQTKTTVSGAATERPKQGAPGGLTAIPGAAVVRIKQFVPGVQSVVSGTAINRPKQGALGGQSVVSEAAINRPKQGAPGGQSVLSGAAIDRPKQGSPPIGRPRQGSPGGQSAVSGAAINSPKQGAPGGQSVVSEAAINRPKQGAPGGQSAVSGAAINSPKQGALGGQSVVSGAAIDRPKQGFPPIDRPRRGFPGGQSLVSGAAINRPKQGAPGGQSVVSEAAINRPKQGAPGGQSLVSGAAIDRPKQGSPPINRPRQGSPGGPSAVSGAAINHPKQGAPGGQSASVLAGSGQKSPGGTKDSAESQIPIIMDFDATSADIPPFMPYLASIGYLGVGVGGGPPSGVPLKPSTVRWAATVGEPMRSQMYYSSSYSSSTSVRRAFEPPSSIMTSVNRDPVGKRIPGRSPNRPPAQKDLPRSGRHNARTPADSRQHSRSPARPLPRRDGSESGDTDKPSGSGRGRPDPETTSAKQRDAVRSKTHTSVLIEASRRTWPRWIEREKGNWLKYTGELVLVVSFLTFTALCLGIRPHVFMALVFGGHMTLFLFRFKVMWS